MTPQQLEIIQQLETLQANLKKQRDELERLIRGRQEASNEEAEAIRKLKQPDLEPGPEAPATHNELLRLRKGRLMVWNEMLFKLQELQGDKKDNLALLRSIMPPVEQLFRATDAVADDAPVAPSVAAAPTR
ncbi:hypothetical protein P0Y43_01970 [Pseudomonas entomophila]|uniref:hypothetical protein n=1 Tax=Pseudomonas entomophila TaxID=312306 RepID=UPI0023D7F96E|nr:hypothetical protein [Pseudomonas entomophila]MDF0729493.1 hypothetical protein [Pseudomonas entomophila]